MPYDGTDDRAAEQVHEPDLTTTDQLHEPDQAPGNRRTLAIVGVLTALALALVVAGWQIATAGLPHLRGGSAAAARIDPTTEAIRTARPSETFVVPVPSYATPSLEQPLGPMVPMVEEPVATQVAPATHAPAPPPPAPPPAIKVSGIRLECSGSRNKVTAKLSFQSSAPVAVSVTAANRTETTTAGGDVDLSIESKSAQPATCSAIVNGVAVGPIPAR